MSRLKTTIDSIAARLAPMQESGLKILNTPNADRLPKVKAQCLIFYAGKFLDPPEGTRAPLMQKETLRIAINLQMADLRSHEGAYDFIEEIGDRLKGFPPEGESGAMYQVSEDYVSLEDGVWLYSLVFALPGLSGRSTRRYKGT